MAVIKILYTLLLVGFVGFLFFGQSPEGKDGRILRSIRRQGPRVRLHKATAEVNPKLDHIAFDPKVAEIEQKHDDRAWEKDYFRHHKEELERIRRMQEQEGLDEKLLADQDAAAERAQHYGVTGPDHVEDDDDIDSLEEEEADYLSPDHFNITDRLATLFPAIDLNPHDGYISLDELSAWHVEQAKRTSQHRTDREMEVTDKDNDGFVTLKEYIHDDSPGEEIHMDLPGDDDSWLTTAQKQFPLADINGDGKLDSSEFNDFLHPEDSDNPKLKGWLRQEEIRQRDTDKDGKLSLTEFQEHLYDELREFGEEDPVDTAVRSHVGKDPHEARPHLSDAMETKTQRARAKFTELDTDKSGFLTEDELQPIMEKLQPGEKFYARQQAQHMVEQADGNHDGRLTVEEMIEHPYVFYNVAYDDDDDEDHHDEFR